MNIKNSWPKLINWFLTNPKTSGLVVFISLSTIFSYVALQQYQIDKENKRVEMNNILKTIQQNIDQALKNSYTTTLSLALTINDNGVPENFDSIGKKLLKSNQSINAVQLVPNGIIKYIYPMKGNEAAMNLNILKVKHLKEEALLSITNQKMYFAGPFVLKQGGQGIVGRLPVYIKNDFWGFSAVIIKLDKLLKVAGINAIDSSKYAFQMSKKNQNSQKENFILPQKVIFSKNNFVKLTIPDGNWNIYLINKKANRLHTNFIVTNILGILLALTFGGITILILKKPAELQILVEEQAIDLINSEIKFKTIFDQAAIGIANVDSNTGKFIEINEQLCKLLGYSQKEMKEKNFQSITHPDDLEIDMENLQKIKDGTIRKYSLEKRYFTKKGAVIWVNLSVSPLWNKNAKPTSTIAIVEDITLKKEAEELIKESENHFKSLFEDSPLPLREEDFSKVKNYLKKLNLISEDVETVKSYFKENPHVIHECHSLIKVININKACFNLYKVKNRDELLNSKSKLFNTKSFNDFTEQLIAITQNKNRYFLDTIIKNSENEFRNIDLRWNVIRGYEKSLKRIIVSNEDITQRKITEEIILNSQQKIESLINTIDGIVWECDAQTFEFNFISKKVEEILGYTSEEWLFSPTFWKDHIYEEDKNSTLQFCQEKTSNNEDHDFEYRMIAKDGRIVWLRDIVSVIKENNKAISLRGIMIDITKTKEIENDLNNSFNLVSEQNKRLLNFSYIVSHNLRSHTSNITSLTGLIETSESDEEREQIFQLLKTVSNSLNETLANLNEVVNIQTNIGLVIEKIKLKSYVDNTLNILAEQIKLKGAIITSSISTDVEVNYNPAYLESILFNIISNAIRYSDPNREPIIKIASYLENKMIVLEISDNGIGIDLKKNGDKIFGMYKTFSNNPDSRGIGLFITKNQIDAMGGKITIDSKPNLGTTFKIFIS